MREKCREKKTVKEVEVHKFLVCSCKSQDFAQRQKFFGAVAQL